MVKPTIDDPKTLRFRVSMMSGRDNENNLKIDVASNIDNKAIFVQIEDVVYVYDVFGMIDECCKLYRKTHKPKTKRKKEAK